MHQICLIRLGCGSRFNLETGIHISVLNYGAALNKNLTDKHTLARQTNISLYKYYLMVRKHSLGLFCITSADIFKSIDLFCEMFHCSAKQSCCLRRYLLYTSLLEAVINCKKKHLPVYLSMI